MWEFDNKKYFLLLIAVALLALLFIAYCIWQKKTQKKFASAKALAVLIPDYSKNKPVLKGLLFLFALILIILGLVNPKIGTRIETVKRQGIDIVFVLDVSKSMLADDIAPDRLSKSKQIVSQLINNLGSDRVGIVGYAASAFPMLPITTDYYAAKMYLQSMNTDMVSSQGTDFEEAIRVASNFFDNPNTSKLMILISDGEDHGADMANAVAIAKEKGIQIISIGVGTEQGGTIPIKTARGFEYKKDWEGNTVITKMNPQTLEYIAKETKGKYYYGGQTQEVIQWIQHDLEQIEKTDFESQQIAEFQSQFQWLLGAAFLLLFIDVFIKERKTKWMQKRNLFHDKE